MRTLCNNEKRMVAGAGIGAITATDNNYSLKGAFDNNSISIPGEISPPLTIGIPYPIPELVPIISIC